MYLCTYVNLLCGKIEGPTGRFQANLNLHQFSLELCSRISLLYPDANVTIQFGFKFFKCMVPKLRQLVVFSTSQILPTSLKIVLCFFYGIYVYIYKYVYV